MRHTLQRLIALCLVLAWGPATLCCALEAAGLENHCAGEECHSSAEPTTPLECCNALEAGNFQSVVSAIKLGPPAASACVGLLCLKDLLDALPPAPVADVRDYERPRDWTKRWHFERRAAGLAHAPDSLIG